MSRYNMKRTTGRCAHKFVRDRLAFKAGNLFGCWYPIKPISIKQESLAFVESLPTDYREIYAVHSYGFHWPLFVYDPVLGNWYENNERYDWRDGAYGSMTWGQGCGRRGRNKYSPTTDQHHRDANPHALFTMKFSADDLKVIVHYGVEQWQRLREEQKQK